MYIEIVTHVFSIEICVIYNSNLVLLDCSDIRFGENCEEICNSRCRDNQDGRDCNITTGVCLTGCEEIETPSAEDWWLGDWCDIFIRTYM